MGDPGWKNLYPGWEKLGSGISIPDPQHWITCLGFFSSTVHYHRFPLCRSGTTRFVTLKVYNDIAAELSMAVLKYIKKTKNPPEEILFRCIKSLVKFRKVTRKFRIIKLREKKICLASKN
jgi:hypothetical protein